MQATNERRTTDKRLAAYLITQGVTLVDTVIEYGYPQFIFADTPDVDAAIKRFITGQATVEVKTFTGAFGYVRNLASKAWNDTNSQATKTPAGSRLVEAVKRQAEA